LTATMNRIVKALKTGVLLIYFPVILIVISTSNRAVTCTEVNVLISDSLSYNFTSAGSIRRAIIDKFPGLVGSNLRKLDFEEIELFVNELRFVRDADVFSSPSGILNVKVYQYHPVLRVFDGDRTFYLDKNGTRFPTSTRYTERVLVASGNIPDDKSELLEVVRIINEDPFWEAQMKQIFIRGNNDYVLVPRVGDHLILLGPPIRVDEKLRNLKALYKKGLSPREWNEFQLINLKFEGQVICSRSRDF